ncbi:MAG: hypothetical protein ABI663_03820 [Chryseolinea sp.]
MGKIKNNVVTKGFSGKLGDDLVFRQVDGKTIFAKRTLSSVAPSERQNEVRNKFTEASLFASAALENPETSREYNVMAKLQGVRTAYMAAVTDYLTLPEIGAVYAFAYKGAVGDLITISDRTPYKIVDLSVTILRADGAVLESGKAVANGLKWRYVSTVANPLVSGCKLVLTARDRQAKESTLEKVL